MAHRGLGEPVLMLSGLRRGLGSGSNSPTPVCPHPALTKRPNIFDKVVPRGPDGVPVYDPDVGYTHDIEMYPPGVAPKAPWMWGKAGVSFGSTFPQSIPRDFPASLMPRLDAVGTPATWHLGQIGATIQAQQVTTVRPVTTIYHPKYSYDVAQIQRVLVEHLGPLGGNEFIEHYWAGNTTNAILRVLPDTIEIEVRDPRTGQHPVATDKAKTVEITIVAGSAEEFRRIFPAASLATASSGTSSDIPTELDEAKVRGLLEECGAAGTYGQQLNCMAVKLYREYGVAGTSAEGHALYDAMLRAIDRIHQEDAEAPQGIVSFDADSAAEEAAGKTVPPDPLYQPKAAEAVPKGSLVFTETSLPEGIEKEEESFSTYASKHAWVKPVAIGGGIAVAALIGLSILRRR
jgi:hypothetical protein